ncbi:assimilatory sulfite reductase (NADPH) flavoprotein subunit [Kurthia sibirica]|uniref:assimilatory sulfite reductase (NADPH) n=1 Tax=Kurthia sibirica TaxID=202750 RepID=A0A2U3ALP5_9BACL|nr:assimilatory sulfite reductase (NADPH) flavoprotein subunit [Kurthia sibirica]PWI25454.1 assimilatory sulfite reductase (NADPH) flavoprotein subunit [Kurthia sibirica]GEK34965.1 sulfite reductase [NADPH] flavoprotein alpha-component [Kurthia sibirica]
MLLEVVNSPFNEKQATLLNDVMANLTQQQKIWLNGYLTATLNNTSKMVVEETTSLIKTVTATILYGSQTGNAKRLAQRFGEELAQNQVVTTVKSMADFPVNKLKKIENLLIITSTQGEGEAPDNSKTFYDFIHSERAPKLANSHYAVLALGDTSYDLFCQTGIDFDKRLIELGAQSLVPRVDCDLDYEEEAECWFTAVQQQLMAQSGQLNQVDAPLKKVVSTENYSKKKPYSAKVLEKINLNMTGSDKATYHLELSLENAGIEYEPGDSLGVYAKNNEELVAALLMQLSLDGQQLVTIDQIEITLTEALLYHYEITVLTKPLIAKFEVENLPHENWREGRNIVDLLRYAKITSLTAAQLLSKLRKLPARLYSIASSLAVHEEEVHITVGQLRYAIDDHYYDGVCSGFIANEVQIGDELKIFVQRNEDFKLPASNQPIIMIGAGTGIAPYRAFMEQREEQQATGSAWLFFGDQHFMTDFLYQTEWLRYLNDGVLTSMDVAFSRDQQHKIYVQQRIIEKGAEFYNWLEKGAVIYICGDEKKMAKDVETAILEVIATYGQLTEQQAQHYLVTLLAEKRYLRDVY